MYDFIINIYTQTLICCYSIGRTARQESTLRSRRNPISKPLRRQSGKVRTPDSKVTLRQSDVSAESASDSDVTSPGSADSRTNAGIQHIGGSVDSRLRDMDTDADDEFHPALAERVKLRRMSQPSSDNDSDKNERSKSQLIRSAAEKASAGMRKTHKDAAAGSGKKLSSNRLALMKKKSAVRKAVSSSKAKPSIPKSVKPGDKQSVERQQAGSDATAGSRITVSKLKQSSKKQAGQTSKPKSAGSVSGSVAAPSGSNQKFAAAQDARQPQRSSNSSKTMACQGGSASVDDAAQMPRLKANSKQNATNTRVISMPVLQQELLVADTSRSSAKKSPRKRPQPTPTKFESKSPKLSSVAETEKRSLRNSDVRAEMSFGDDDMPQLSEVEKMKPLKVVVDHFELPPELDRSPLCDAAQVDSIQPKSSCQSPAECLSEKKAAAVKTSPRSVRTMVEHAGDASKNAAPKLTPARPRHHASTSPVSNCTALSQNNSSISSWVAVTQTMCSASSQHSKVAVMQTEYSLQRSVAGTQTSCSTSLQPTLNQTSLVAKDEHLSTTDGSEPSSELVPYTCPPPNTVSAQWQVPCGVPMAPFIITGMYPMMGSGYGCQMMQLPAFVSPAMPAASAVLSSRSGNLLAPPLQYSSYQLPRSAAAPVVPLYMSPVVGPYLQSGSPSPQLNLMQFMPSVPHAAASVQNQPSSTTLILRPSMPPTDHMYCMLPGQRQVNLLSSG